ncbi:protein toll-like isoform 3-T4 [Cochliomyia hominivorax]
MYYTNITSIVYIPLLIIMVTIIPANGFTFIQLNMEIKKSNCSLSGTMLLSYYLIKCPINDVKLHLVLGPGLRIQIKCFNLNYSEFQKILPNVTIGTCQTLEIKNCPLSENIPISSIMQQLNIYNVDRLILKHNKDLSQNLDKVHFHNLYSIKNLTLKLENTTTIPGDLFSDLSLKNLESLDMVTGVKELPHNIFNNLENIEYMTLGENLNSLSDDIFRKQNNLTLLILSNNNLLEFKKELISHCSSLKVLDLENNLIEVLTSDIFASLTKLMLLNLSGNKFATLPPGLLQHNKELTEVILRQNKISLKNLPSEFFANLPKLTEISLQCGLKQIHSDLFRNSRNIEMLRITDNKFTNLPHGLLSDQIFLKYLNLSNNNLQQIPDDLLQNTTNLKIIHLSHNQLRKFKSEMFRSTTQIETIHFDDNKLTTSNIEMLWSFRYLRDLRTLDFSHNSITSISRNWIVPYFLETFDLSYNNLTSLNNNELIYLVINNLELNLKHNQITSVYIHNETLGLRDFQKQLLKIDLNRNPIKCDCNLLSFVQFLKDPSKNFNLKENIHFLLKDLTCMEPVNLRGNYVKDLEAEILVCEYKEQCPVECSCILRSYDEMLMIDCSKRNLMNVPDLHGIKNDTFKGIELNIQGNRLTTLPSNQVAGYAHVTRLIVANNYLAQLQKHQLPGNLTVLDIRGNFLETLGADILNIMNSSKLSEVYLSDNLWLCDCEARNLLRFTQSNIQLFKDFSNVTCANTEHLTYFYELQDLCPIEHNFYIFILIAALCLLLALYYKYQNEIKIWLYAHNMCLC